MSYSKIVSTGRYLPANIMKNNDFLDLVETSDEWIITRTGIKERRISDGEDIIEIATNAAKNALEKANVKPEELDLIVLSTTTQQNILPCTACSIQNEIKALNAAAFDVFAACSGFLFGMEIADKFIKNGSYKKALIIGAEVLSKIIDWKDRNTCVLFGDGAAAAVIEKSENFEGIKSISIKSDGTLGHNLTCSAGISENPFTVFNKDVKDKVVMNGKEIFKFAVSKVTSSIEKILTENNLKPEDIDHVVCHQANKRIIQSAAKKTGIELDRFYMNLERYGNTSSASIGIALDEMIEKKIVKNGHKIILVGFGGGLTWGSTLIEFEDLAE